jgi:hypothetical protein
VANLAGSTIDVVTDAVHRAIEARVKEAIDAEIEKAKGEIEKRIRGDAATIAATVLRRFSMERFGETLRIEIDFKNAK